MTTCLAEGYAPIDDLLRYHERQYKPQDLNYLPYMQMIFVDLALVLISYLSSI